MLWWFAQTTLIAAGLALVAGLAGRWKRLGPEARHALWFLVLVKLAMPPFVAWPWGLADAWPVSKVELVSAPRPIPIESPAPMPRAIDDPAPSPPPPIPFEVPDRPEVVEAPPPLMAPEVASIPIDSENPAIESKPGPREPIAIPVIPDLLPAPREPAADRVEAWRSAIIDRGPLALLGLWLAGSIGVVIRRAIKISRFRRTLADSTAAPDWLVEQARAIGERVGVRPPRMMASPAVGTPMLWCLGLPRLILPTALIKGLDADRWSGILAHELAHLARRDHWVVRLELALEAVWWWNPLFWHARRRLHDEAEQACDARVVRSLPERRFAYAEALVDVCEHLARAAIPSPSLGVGGAGASRSLEGRLLMILRDPIPRRPSRRGAWLAAFLAASTLPAWTLGQQQPDPPKLEAASVARPVEAPGAEIATPAGPIKATTLSVADVQKGVRKRLDSFENLAMRYVVASRSESPAGPSRQRRVQVEAGDVLYEFPERDPNVQVPIGPIVPEASRLDVFGAKPGEANTVPWSRWLEFRTDAANKSLRVDSTGKDPARFRWQALSGQKQQIYVTRQGWSLGMMLTRDSSLLDGHVADPVPTLYTPDQRPLVALDLDGPTLSILADWLVQANVTGSEMVEGREAVRIAWVGRGQGGARGIAWFAPDLGFALVRSEAFVDGLRDQFSLDRRWVVRKLAGGFTRSGETWLPGKVTTRLSEVDPEGQATVIREQVITLENYQVNAELPETAFEAEFPVQGLDEKTGDFITTPPAPPAGLIARLERAVRESPFGPPLDQEIDRKPKEAAAGPRDMASRPEIFADNAVNPKASPGRGADIKLEPKSEETSSLLNIENEIIRRFRLDPEINAITTRMNAADEKLTAVKRVAIVPTDPALRTAQRQFDILKKQYDDLWTTKSKQFREELKKLGGPLETARDEIELLEIRRNRKASEVRKAKAMLELARDELNNTKQLSEMKRVSPKELALYKGKFDVAEAELAGIQSDFDEAELLVKQARRRLEAITGPSTDAGPAKVPPPAAESEAIKNLRDRQAEKAAELAKARAQLDRAKATLASYQEIIKSGKDLTREEFSRGAKEVEIAEADLAGKKAGLEEVELLINQAMRRPNGVDPGKLGADAAGPPATNPSLVELRDAVEVMEIQLRNKQAELRRVELKAELADQLEWRVKMLVARNAIGQREVDTVKAEVQAARAEVDPKKAAVLEVESRLKQARGKLEAVLLKADVERARARLDWSIAMFKKGVLSRETAEADKKTHDDAMLRLDPKYVPTPLDLTAVSATKGGVRIVISGQKSRFSGQAIDYKLSVFNFSPTPAKAVKVAATLPTQGGKLVARPPDATFAPETRKLLWSMAQIEPGQGVELTFRYGTNTPGAYQADVEVTSDEGRAIDTMTTEVLGTTVVDLQVTQTSRVVDAGKSNFYDIIIKNAGTREANRLQLKGKLTANLKPVKHFNVEKGDLKFDPNTGEFQFPEIERLAIGQTINLALEVQSDKPGPAGGHFFLSHAGMAADEPAIEDVISTTVVDTTAKKD